MGDYWGLQDNAASEIILYESGCEILSWPNRGLLRYNKINLETYIFCL